MKTDDLLRVAEGARARAYAPYSQFHVGAAVQTADGSLIPGCNMENASYGLTVCAERNALAAAVVQGKTEVKALMVVSERGVAPCGACRQVIWEMCGDIPVYLADAQGTIQETTSRALLPQAFDQRDLNG